MPCKHTIRKIFFVESKDIERNRPLRDAKTLLGTRKVQSVRDCSSRGKLLTRRLSCFCEGCIQGNFEGCINTEYIDAWKPVILKPFIPITPVVNDIDNQTRDHGGRGVRTIGGRRATGVRTRGGRGRQEGQIRGGGGQGRQGRRGRGQGRCRKDGGYSSEVSTDDPSSEESSDDPSSEESSDDPSSEFR
ncbi:uncharacterized protein [Argopecten irradians]|uniref:uncharacterized protein n=1 Tax=Argopecten irradians TaxID=31199 RepID=UPI003717ECEE